MDTKAEFNQSFRFTKVMLLLSGIQIDQFTTNRLLGIFMNWFFYLGQFWLHFDILGEIRFIIDTDGDKTFQDIAPLIPCITISILGTVKAAPLYFQRNDLIRFFEGLSDIHPSVTNAANVSEEQKIIRDATADFKKVVRMYKIMCVVVVTPFNFLPAVIMAYERYMLGATEVKFPYAVKYFFDPTKPGVWPFVYVHQVMSTSIVMLNVIGADSLFYGMCKFLQMHFRVLRCRLEALFDEHCDSSTRPAIKPSLRECVMRHQLLIEFVNQMEKLFTFATLCNFVSSSFLICLCVFNLTLNLGFRSVSSFGPFLALSLFQILMYCYGGDMVMQSSKDMSLAVYSSLWYLADKDLQKSITIIHLRAQRPCKLTAANFADLNLSAFATVLRRSWSYLALLKTMYE